MKYRYILFAVILIILTGCASYEKNSVDKYKNLKETHEQTYVDYYLSFRYELSEEVEISGKKVFVPKYGILKLVDLEKRLQSLLVVINQLTDYSNEDAAKFVDENKLRDELERDKKIVEAQLGRIKNARLHEEFRSKLGVSFHGMANENGKYDAKRIFWPKNMVQSFPFTFDKIDDAEERKVLKEIEHEIWSSKRELDRKEPDPLKLDDPNAFVWKSKDESLDLTSFKIFDREKPDNNQSDYIEGFRMPNGKREKLPALKIFFPHGNSNGVMVLDFDKENESGFGIPDTVEDVFISRIADVWDNGTIIPRLFQEKEKRIVAKKPEPKPINVEIARLGNPVDTWEISKDLNGWTVPFNHRNDIGNNYNIKLKLEEVKSEMILNRKIEYIAKEWTGQNAFVPSVGAVIEYFKPKFPYNKDNISKAEVKSSESPKMVSFVFEDGVVDTKIVTHVSNLVIEDEPYAVEYTEGQKRWRLEKDKDSKIFNKKKEVPIK